MFYVNETARESLLHLEQKQTSSPKFTQVHPSHPVELNDEESDEVGNGWSINSDEESDSDIENKQN